MDEYELVLLARLRAALESWDAVKPAVQPLAVDGEAPSMTDEQRRAQQEAQDAEQAWLRYCRETGRHQPPPAT